MKPKVSTHQLAGVIKLLKNLKSFEDQKYGLVIGCVVMVNPMMTDTILVKYTKDFLYGGERQIENKIAAIDQKGEIDFIDNKFHDAFQRAAFISECITFDIDNELSYEKID